MEMNPQPLLRIWFFSIPNTGRGYLGPNSNVELYSLNKSLLLNIVWKFQIRSNGIIIEGRVEKLQNGQPVGFLQQEGIAAIHGNFLGSFQHPITQLSSFVLENFYVGKVIGFTLRANQSNQEQTGRLRGYANQQLHQPPIPGTYSIETGGLREEQVVANVFGLLHISQPVASLESYVSILVNHFSKSLITWMNVCTNPVMFRKSLFQPVDSRLVNQ